MQQFNSKVVIDALDEGGRVTPVAMVKVKWESALGTTWIALRPDSAVRAEFGPGAFMTAHDSVSGPFGGIVLFNPWTATIQMYDSALKAEHGIVAWGRPVELDSVIVNRDTMDALIAAFK